MCQPDSNKHDKGKCQDKLNIAKDEYRVEKQKTDANIKEFKKEIKFLTNNANQLVVDPEKTLN